MKSVGSSDGTTITFDQWGEGPPLVDVGGALNDRSAGAPLAGLLARDSPCSLGPAGVAAPAGTPPYAVEREVEDLEALIAAAGGLAGAGAAELVTFTKGYEGKRPWTWVHITKLGRDAFQAEVAALKQLVQHFEQLGTDRPQRPNRPPATQTSPALLQSGKHALGDSCPSRKQPAPSYRLPRLAAMITAIQKF